jgi:hypothetical protein
VHAGGEASIGAKVTAFNNGSGASINGVSEQEPGLDVDSRSEPGGYF